MRSKLYSGKREHNNCTEINQCLGYTLLDYRAKHPENKLLLVFIDSKSRVEVQ